MWLETRRTERKWAWSTMNRTMGSLQGALSNLPMYCNCPVPILLSQGVAWRNAMRASTQRMKENEGVDPPACPFESLAAAADTATEPWIRMALRLTWLTAARCGCILQIRRREVQYTASDGALSVTFRRGKGVKFRGPYTVPTEVPPRWRQELGSWLATIRPEEFIFRAESANDRMRMGVQLKLTLQSIDPSLGQRAIRRGALQHMSRLGIPNATLMQFSGHRSEETLLRYLGWGLHAEERAERSREAARLLGGPTSEHRPPDGPTSA